MVPRGTGVTVFSLCVVLAFQAVTGVVTVAMSVALAGGTGEVVPVVLRTVWERGAADSAYGQE